MSRALLATLLVLSAASASAAGFSGYLTAWTQDCAGEKCAPSVGAGESQKVAFSLDAPVGPGEARVQRFSREFHLPTGETVRADVSVYFICPAGAAAGDGGDPCPSRFVQVQTALSGSAQAFCGVSLNLADARPFPVLACAGPSVSSPSRRLGVSLSRLPL